MVGLAFLFYQHPLYVFPYICHFPCPIRIYPDPYHSIIYIHYPCPLSVSYLQVFIGLKKVYHPNPDLGIQQCGEGELAGEQELE